MVILKKILFALSLVFNIIFLFIIVFVSSSNASSFSFLSLDSGIQSAFIVSVPSSGADLSFGPAEFFLSVGGQAQIQFAAIRDGRQSNLAIEPLYDYAIIHVEQTGFGLLITALSPGEAVLQLFSPDGFKTIARVFVYE